MFSFVSNLICKHLPFIASSEEASCKTDSTESQTWVMVLGPNQSACLSDQIQAGKEAPQSYGCSSYTQSVNKVTDKTQKVGISQKQLFVNCQSTMHRMKLVGTALKENGSRNQDVSLDIFLLSGIGKLMMSVRNLQEEKILSSLEDKTGILSETQDEIEYDYSVIKQEDELTTPNQDVANKLTILSQNLILWLTKLVDKNKTEQIHAEYDDHDASYGGLLFKLKQIGRTIIGAVVQGVVLFVESPLPGLIYLFLESSFKTLMYFNREFQITERAQIAAVECIKKVMTTVAAAAKKHRLLESVLEALSTLASVTYKAFVVCKTRLVVRAIRRRLQPQYLYPHQRRAMSSSWRWT